jgi:hypothetical protein
MRGKALKGVAAVKWGVLPILVPKIPEITDPPEFLVPEISIPRL